jgi:hypothetical protein
MDHRFNLRLHYGGGRTEDRLVYRPTICLWGVAQWTSDVHRVQQFPPMLRERSQWWFGGLRDLY